jgi:predicted RNA-binding protein with PIN domain
MADDYLIVDGYNIIGAWPDLRDTAQRDLEEARDRLIEILADYQGFSGQQVILVFDAYKVPGLGVKMNQHRLDIRYTKEKETADECIERLVTQLMQRRRRIQVATSDNVEQWVIFGRGALRLSARELRTQVEETRTHVQKNIQTRRDLTRNTFDHRISGDLKEIFERWRRGSK